MRVIMIFIFLLSGSAAFSETAIEYVTVAGKSAAHLRCAAFASFADGQVEDADALRHFLKGSDLLAEISADVASGVIDKDVLLRLDRDVLSIFASGPTETTQFTDKSFYAGYVWSRIKSNTHRDIVEEFGKYSDVTDYLQLKADIALAFYDSANCVYLIN